MNLDALIKQPSSWLRVGEDGGIVVSSRIRLARNLADYPFISRATEQDRARIEKSLRDCLLGSERAGKILYLDIERLAGLDRQFLVERHLISREHADGQGARAVAIRREANSQAFV